MTDMTIKAIRTTFLRVPWPNDPWLKGHAFGEARNLLMLEVETRGGIVVMGYLFSFRPGLKTVVAALEETLLPHVIGKDATAVEGIWNETWKRTVTYNRGGIVTMAMSALDIALWDAIGKRANMPLGWAYPAFDVLQLEDYDWVTEGDAAATARGVAIGTPRYMSPEQVRGQEVDARSDLYAMGLVLYELLTGKTVFLDGDVMRRQLTEVPPVPSSQVEGIPPLLDQIIMKAIAKKPEERFQTARDFVAHLREVNK